MRIPSNYQNRWSFGGNRLQIKAEVRLIADLEATLRSSESIGLNAVGVLKSLAIKQDLLLALLENEQMRLEVWLYPLDHERRHFFPSGRSGRPPFEVK